MNPFNWCNLTFVAAECGGKLQATADWQEIKSPNHPKVIDPLQECTWQLSAPTGQVIYFEFVGPDFGFPSTTASGIIHCDPNYVEIRYRADLLTTGPKFCGADVPTRNLTSQKNQAMVLMRAPVSKIEREKHTVPTTSKGFKLRFKAISPPSDLEVEEAFVPVNSRNAAKFIKDKLSRCCADRHQLCCYWATTGECDTNAEYMRINCQRACGTCGCKRF